MKRWIYFLSVLLLMGCSDTHIVEDVGFINSMALDVPEDEEQKNKILVTASIPQINTRTENEREVLSAVANSDKEAMMELSSASNRQLLNGKMELLLFGEGFAEGGIDNNIKTFSRDPKFSGAIHVVVAEGQAKSVLEPMMPNKENPSIYLEELIEKEIRANTAIKTDLHDFLRDLHDKGKDPVTALVTLRDDEPMINGIALFQNEKMVDTMPLSLVRYYMFLAGFFSAGSLGFEHEDHGEKAPLTFNCIRNDRRITVDYTNIDDIKVTVHLTVKGSLLEYNGDMDMSDNKDQTALEKIIEEHITQIGDGIIATLQEQQVDPIGIGKHVRNHIDYQTWQEMNWREDVYPNVDVEIKTDVTIKDIGVTK
ncbi:Ger(x)C family spore germination protein [Pontibacillus salicampi]|uniref:Ger(X)C family spore germination protein n=1 Tax=Pontibacillus salicampi TaxID=1449801 RepID=A0ABV6LLI2_9BACI